MKILKSHLFVIGCILVSLPSLAGAQNLPFGQTQTGTIASAAQSNTYTFSASANDVIDFTMVTTSGSLLPRIRLYNPDGTLLSSAGNFGSCASVTELNTVKLPASGTYTVLVGDCTDTNTGNYVIYAESTKNPAGCVPILWGQVQAGTIASAAQSNCYTFSASAKDVVDFTLVTTSGSLLPRIRLYNPDGTLLSSAGDFGACASVIELNTVKLPATGTYTVLVGDCTDTNKGGYNVYAQSTNNPIAPIPVLWGQVQVGAIGKSAQSDTYALSGSANDVVSFTIVTTSGSLLPRIRLYNPDGTLLSSAGNFGACASVTELNNVKLTQNGHYTVLVGDCVDTNTGNYNFSSQCLVGPCPVLPPLTGDFDGDRKADAVVWRPSNGTWYVIPSSNPSAAILQQWGTSGDIPVRGDYDGDGKTDFAVFRPSNGTWFIIPSGNPANVTIQQWGTNGDIPVPGDYDGDGKTDFAVFRPSNGTWYIIPSSNPSSPILRQWGTNGDIPVPGDYDGDGKTDFAVFRPSNGTWYIIPSSNPSAPILQQWGTNGDIPVPGDYDGDGKTDFAVWRPSNGVWFIIPTSNPSAPILQQWGTSGDIPVPVDYDGDRKTDIAVWRPSGGNWFIIPSSAPSTFTITQWGTNGDVPVQKPIGQ